MLEFEVNSNPVALVKCFTAPQMRKILNLLTPGYLMSDALSMLIAQTLFEIDGRLSEARYIRDETPIEFLDCNVRINLYDMHRFHNLSKSTFQRVRKELNGLIFRLKSPERHLHAISEESMKRALKKLEFHIEYGTHIRAWKPVKAKLLSAYLTRPDAQHPEWVVAFHITDSYYDCVDVNGVQRIVRTETDLRKEVQRIETFVNA